MNEWVKTADRLPPNDLVVDTKIDDPKGLRNECKLKLYNNRLWFFSDGSMYVYYQPTHWRLIGESK